MKSTTLIVVLLIITAIAFGVSMACYSHLPGRMVSHWNSEGEPDGNMSKPVALFLMPCMLLVFNILAVVLPGIDPLRKNFAGFRNYYFGFMIVLSVFLTAIHVWMVMWNMGIRIRANLFFSIGFGALFFTIGAIMPHCRRNWFMGIRTPWTLSSESVWDKTHRLGGYMFGACGILAFFGGLAGKYAIWFIISPVITSSLFLFVFSYYAYRKEHYLN